MGWFDATARSEAEIEREISDEIEFHLEQRTRELVEQGMSEVEARAEAERRFGSPERVRAKCRQVQLGERIMLQRIQLALNVVVVLAIVALGWSLWSSNHNTQDQLQKLSALLEARATPPAPETPRGPSELERSLEPFRNLKDAQSASALAVETTGLEPSRGRTRMQDGWPLVADPKLRLALLAPFVEGGGHSFAVDILHLAATDPAPEVREEAFRYLKDYAWQDFSGKPLSVYQEWYSHVRGMDTVGCVRTSMLAYCARLRLLSGAELRREIEFLDRVDLAPTNARAFNLLAELWGQVAGETSNWIQSDDGELQLAGLRFVAHFKLDRQYREQVLGGLVFSDNLKSMENMIAACRAFAAGGQVRAMVSNINKKPDAIYRLMRLVIEHDSPEVREIVGGGVLAPLLSLESNPSRGAAEWLAWWKDWRTQHPSKPEGECDDSRWLDAR